MALAGLSAAADQLQIAREWAVLGDYDTARLYYQGVASQVARWDTRGRDEGCGGVGRRAGVEVLRSS